MNENYEITRAIPQTAQQVSLLLKRTGCLSFWFQIVLGAVSTVLLFIATASFLGGQKRTQGIEVAVLCAYGGVLLLGVGIYFALRYGRMAKAIMNPNPKLRPGKTDTLQVIRYGLIVNLVGMLLSIFGAEAFAGILLVKSFNLSPLLIGASASQYVNSADMAIVQANTNTIAAHFSGIVMSLWLLNRLTNLSK
jgi:hypothetical protein